MFYGKHFSSMYERSMVGSGAIVFAVWGYVIANQEPDRTVGAQVTLNADLLAAILGESREAVEKAIARLCAPDPRSTTKREEGRRLVKIGEFDYRVVNGPKYLAIRNEETRREQNRDAKRRERAKQTPLGGSKILNEGGEITQLKTEALLDKAGAGATPEPLEPIVESASAAGEKPEVV